MKLTRLNRCTINDSVFRKRYLLQLVQFAFIIASLMLLGTTTEAQPTKTKSSAKIIQSIPCSGRVKYYKNGKIRSCYLSDDYAVEGNQLPSGSKLLFDENGKPAMCIIKRDTKFYGQSLPAKSYIFFNRWGQKLSFWLPRKTRIQGYLIAANNLGVGNSLHQNGKLKAIWLADDEEINGIPCTSSENILKFGFQVLALDTKRMVWFYDNGQLNQAMLSCNFTIQGHPFRKGDIVIFDKNGKVDLTLKELE
jgi:hypothetical protein